MDIGTSRCPPGERFFLRIITALRSGESKIIALDGGEEEEEEEEKEEEEENAGLLPLLLFVVPAPPLVP
jgi:hypothetical protein